MIVNRNKMISGQSENYLGIAHRNIQDLLEENRLLKEKLEKLNNLDLGPVAEAAKKYADDYSKIIVGDTQSFSFIKGVKWLADYLEK
jgi:hypothetical protein